MSVIPLAVKRRVLEADARIDQLEKLLRTWVAYCDQSGEGKPFNDLNPVHVLLRDTREALKPAFLRQGMETAVAPTEDDGARRERLGLCLAESVDGRDMKRCAAYPECICSGPSQKETLPIATGTGITKSSVAPSAEVGADPTWRCTICNNVNPDDATHCRQCEYSRMVTREGRLVPRDGRL